MPGTTAAKKGFDLWNDWSSKFDSYDGVQSLKSKWPTFVSDGGITMSTINRKVNRVKKSEIEGLEDDELIQFALDNWVLIEKPNEVADLSRLVGESAMALTSMKNSSINRYVTVMEKRGTSGEQLPKKRQLFDVWLRHRDRKTVHDYRYIPSQDRILTGNQIGWQTRLEYYNSYNYPEFDLVDDTNLLKYFTNHMKYLFGDNYDMVINWFAQIIQHPGKRHRVALHSISQHQGTGRGWIVKVFNELCGDNVTTVPSLADMTKTGAKNGYLHESVLVTVNEMVCSGPDRYEQMNKLKTMLSDDVQSIDIKYGAQSYKTKVYTRMFCQANGITDLPVDEHDTRFMVCLNTKQPKSDQYYEHLHGLLNSDTKSYAFLNQVYSYLMRWKINEAWLQRAPLNKDKIKVIQACKSPTGLAFYNFKMLVGDGIFNKSDFSRFIISAMSNGNSMGDVGGFDIASNRELTHLCKQEFNITHKISLKGRIITVHSFEYKDLTKMNSKEIKKQLRKTHLTVKKQINKIN